MEHSQKKLSIRWIQKLMFELSPLMIYLLWLYMYMTPIWQKLHAKLWFKWDSHSFLDFIGEHFIVWGHKRNPEKCLGYTVGIFQINNVCDQKYGYIIWLYGYGCFYPNHFLNLQSNLSLRPPVLRDQCLPTDGAHKLCTNWCRRRMTSHGGRQC